MDTVQVWHALQLDRYTRDLVRGVYARDHLPRQVTYVPSAYVINTDNCERPGQHWVAVYVDMSSARIQGEYFDSYGLPPLHQDILTWLDRGVDEWTWNPRRLQNPDTAVCGQYCLYYLTQRARGRAMNSIVHTLDTSCTTYDNDVLVFDWADRQFGIRPPFFVSSFYRAYR